MRQLLSPYERLLQIDTPTNPIKGSGAAFLWGPRGTGKTTFLQGKYGGADYYDLLDTDLSMELSIRPKLLREKILAKKPALVIVDEIQKIPALMDEIHWLLENTSVKFILCGSSARKLKRQAKNFLGGRAVKFELFPLTSAELGKVDASTASPAPPFGPDLTAEGLSINPGLAADISPRSPGIDLDRLLNFGALPLHYLSEDPKNLLKAYVHNYLKEEIVEEALVRRVPNFSRFLNTVALTHGQLLNYSNVGREAGVSPATVRDYYQILIDTLLGHELEPWRRRKSRRLIETAKFYLFDVGVANHLNPEISAIVQGTDAYGNAFEHFLIEDVRAYLSYKRKDYPLSFWRTSSGFEVDLIIGDLNAALEFKSAAKIRSSHLRGVKAFVEENTAGRVILVSRDDDERLIEGGIELMHWQKFCRLLWGGEII